MKQSVALVGVSQCLLGDKVRYDGQAKPHAIVIENLSKLFELVAICPEVEAGFGIPRPAVQLTGDIQSPQLIGRDDKSIDITQQLQLYCDKKIPSLADLNGFIFKSKSPSCGYKSTPVHIANEIISTTESGLFAKNLCKTYPRLIVIDEIALEDKTQRENFINSVQLAYQLKAYQSK